MLPFHIWIFIQARKNGKDSDIYRILSLIYHCIWWRVPTFWQVDSLQAKLLEKLEQSLVDLQLKMEEMANVSLNSIDPSKQGDISESVPPTAHEVRTKSNTILVLNLWLMGCEMWMQMSLCCHLIPIPQFKYAELFTILRLYINYYIIYIFFLLLFIWSTFKIENWSLLSNIPVW